MDRLSTYKLNREEVVALLEAANAENARLRARIDVLERALEAAPHPWAYPNRLSASEWDDVYHMWYASQRQAALKEEAE